MVRAPPTSAADRILPVTPASPIALVLRVRQNKRRYYAARERAELVKQVRTGDRTAMAKFVPLTEAGGDMIWVNLDQILWFKRPGEAETTTIYFGQGEDAVWVKQPPQDIQKGALA